MRVGGQTLARVATLIDSHQLSSSFDRALKIGLASPLNFPDKLFFIPFRFTSSNEVDCSRNETVNADLIFDNIYNRNIRNHWSGTAGRSFPLYLSKY